MKFSRKLLITVGFAANRTVGARKYGVATAAKSLINSNRYTITVTAEDMAHNIGSQEVTLEISRKLLITVGFVANRTVGARKYGVATAAKSLINSNRYTITVTAEDMAHNIGSQEVTLEILP